MTNKPVQYNVELTQRMSVTIANLPDGDDKIYDAVEHAAILEAARGTANANTITTGLDYERGEPNLLFLTGQAKLRKAFEGADEFCIYAEREQTLDALRFISEDLAKTARVPRGTLPPNGLFHIGVGREPWFKPWYSDGQIDLTEYVNPPSTEHDAYRMDMPSIKEYHSQKRDVCPEPVVRKHILEMARWAARLGAAMVMSYRMDEHPPMFYSPLDMQIHVVGEPDTEGLNMGFSNLHCELDDYGRWLYHTKHYLNHAR